MQWLVLGIDGVEGALEGGAVVEKALVGVGDVAGAHAHVAHVLEMELEYGELVLGLELHKHALGRLGVYAALERALALVRAYRLGDLVLGAYAIARQVVHDELLAHHGARRHQRLDVLARRAVTLQQHHLGRLLMLLLLLLFLHLLLLLLFTLCLNFIFIGIFIVIDRLGRRRLD